MLYCDKFFTFFLPSIFCCECNNKYDIDDGNLGGKIKNPNQQIRETKIQTNSLEFNNTNSLNGNLTGNLDLQQTISNTLQKDPDSKIPVNPPRVPRDKIPNSIINSKPKLKLIIKESKYLPEGRELIINAGGLVGNHHNRCDGTTIFGDYSVSIININYIYYIFQSKHRNDFEFPEEESKSGQSHAEIKYDRNLDKYQVKSLRGSGCFLKIDKKIVKYYYNNYFVNNLQILENGDLFSFSNFLLQVKIDIKSEDIDNRNEVTSTLLTLEVLFGENDRRKISFDSKDKKIIRIGRLKNEETDFTFPDEDVSRKQCILTYDDNNWYINDGDGENPSSNGTWFFPEKYFNITEGMILRMGTTSFECRFIP